ncbi:Metallothionein expression activator [Ascosphaera pollenicola]|nr:Metallothionein expression activator [Ascosphaera pollenicola]
MSGRAASRILCSICHGPRFTAARTGVGRNANASINVTSQLLRRGAATSAAPARSIKGETKAFSTSAVRREEKQQQQQPQQEQQPQQQTQADEHVQNGPKTLEQQQTQTRPKGSRSAAGKMSLRRVAVEAQRSAHKSLTQENGVRGPFTQPKSVTAYAVAERFEINKVVEILLARGYEPDPFKTGLYPQVVHIQVPVESIHRTMGSAPSELPEDEVGDVFIFPSGTVVSWSLPDSFTSYLANKILLPAAYNAHDTSVAETEDLDYVEDPELEYSTVKGDTIILGTKDHQNMTKPKADVISTKIAFSSGLARSTRLAVLESLLQNYFDSTRNIPVILSKGTRLPFSRGFILRKTGQLLSVRAQLNLYSELTDSLPDIFWDSRHDLGLEGYYDQVGKALDVGIRIKILNERMDYAQEIATVLRQILSETHGVRLEWIVILLIAVEVVFETFRLMKEHREEHKSTEKDEQSDRKVLASSS